MKRYTATFTDRPGAKARYRQALKLMGAEGLSIAEAEVEATDPKPKKDNLPTSEVAKAVADLFGRRHSTEWADEEIAAFKKAVKSTLLTMENIKTVAAHYGTERRKDEHHCRTSVLTFCRHFGTELDKARAAKPKASRALEWPDSNKVVPMPTDPQEAERIRVEALRTAKEFQQQQNERTA